MNLEEPSLAAPVGGLRDKRAAVAIPGHDLSSDRGRHATRSVRRWAGLPRPGRGRELPVVRRLGACGVFAGGGVGAVVALLALTRRRLGYVDRSLALTSVAIGLLCVAAGVVIFTGWRG